MHASSVSADVSKTIDRVRGGLTRLQTVISHFFILFFLQMLAWQHMAHVAHSACLSGRSCQGQSVTARGVMELNPAPPSNYYWTINNLPETHRQQSRAHAALGVRTVTEPENQSVNNPSCIHSVQKVTVSDSDDIHGPKWRLKFPILSPLRETG